MICLKTHSKSQRKLHLLNCQSIPLFLDHRKGLYLYSQYQSPLPTIYRDQMRKCIFCGIYTAGGDTVVIKRSDHFVIFDKFPTSLGHMLVISSKHYKNLLETPQRTVNSMTETAKEISKTLKERMGADGIEIVANIGRAAGQAIIHTHIHVIPRYLPHKHPHFEPHKEMSEAERKSMRKRIVAEIEKNPA